MRFPVVYDVLMRTEIEATSSIEASATIALHIKNFGIEKAVISSYEIIRDDNAFPPKDVYSRHTNGFAIFTSSQKLELLTMIASALEASGRGDSVPGRELLNSLSSQFAYLENSELRGVQV